MDDITRENLEALEKGSVNLGKHIENMQKYGVPVMVCINKYETDTQKEIEFLKEFAKKYDVEVEISQCFEKGSQGTVDFANKVVEILDKTISSYKPLYSLEESIQEKISIICKEIYGAKDVKFLDKAIENIKIANDNSYDKLPICIAKTPSSLTDDAKILGRPKDFTVTIRNIKIDAGAGFIVAYAGNIMTLPGLGKSSKYKDFK